MVGLERADDSGSEMIYLIDAFGNWLNEAQWRAGVRSAPYLFTPVVQYQSTNQFFTNPTGDPDCCWRVYTLEWTLGRMVFKLDDEIVSIFENYFPSMDADTNTLAEFPEPFTGEWVLTMFVVVGGDTYDIYGVPPLEGIEFEQLTRRRLQVDYVRSYTCEE